MSVVRCGDRLRGRDRDASLGASLAGLVATVGQQPQRHRGVIDRDLPKTGGAQGDYGRAVRVDRVGLAALARGRRPRSPLRDAGTVEVQSSPKGRWPARVELPAITLATCRSSVNVAMRAFGASAGTSGERRPPGDARRGVPV